MVLLSFISCSFRFHIYLCLFCLLMSLWIGFNLIWRKWKRKRKKNSLNELVLIYLFRFKAFSLLILGLTSFLTSFTYFLYIPDVSLAAYEKPTYCNLLRLYCFVHRTILNEYWCLCFGLVQSFWRHRAVHTYAERTDEHKE